jgi:hypothetical protein
MKPRDWMKKKWGDRIIPGKIVSFLMFIVILLIGIVLTGCTANTVMSPDPRHHLRT